MVSPVQAQTAVVTKIIEHYAFQFEDVQALKSQIERQLTIVYRQTIAAQLNLYGCQKLATGPDDAAQKWIEEKAIQDVKSIVNTFERELRNKVISIYKGNKKSNRFAYMRALDAWIAGRNGRKNASISLNTMTSARKYAQDRFTRENNIGGKWVFAGPPPVCKDCVRIKGYGPQTFEQTQKAGRQLPSHVNCPHRYQQLIPKKIDCQNAWSG